MQRRADGHSFAPMAIVIMGVSGSGKSTIGSLLAATLGCPFLEGDTFHDEAAIAKMRAGHPLSDEDRWPWLDRLGAALAGAVAESGIAVAACSALKRRYRERLIANDAAPTRFVLLEEGHEALLERLRNRPDHYMPPSLLESQMATLERPDAAEAAIIRDASASPKAICRSILDWLSAPAGCAA